MHGLCAYTYCIHLYCVCTHTHQSTAICMWVFYDDVIQSVLSNNNNVILSLREVSYRVLLYNPNHYNN